MERLNAGAQKYAWGKPAARSKVAQLEGVDKDPKEQDVRYAELWVGVHEKCPSEVISTKESLKKFLVEHAVKYFGQSHLDFFKAPVVPFLLKVLSIDMALSIQCHPTREQAKRLHDADPANYPDPNHKPELICPITDFEALCCMRPVSEVLHFVRQSPPFQRLLGAETIAALEAVSHDDGVTTPDTVKRALHDALEKLYAVPNDVLASCVKQQCELITSGRLADSQLDIVHDVFVRTNRDFANDVGLWMIYFLNYVQMKPGEALFLSACEPHAYLSGDGVEIMANSDNVVRAGLTPKFKDVKNLLEMLTYNTHALANVHYTCNKDSAVQEYQPPAWCVDFSLLAFRLNHANRTATHTLPSLGLGICVKGGVKLTAVDSASLKEGDKFLVPVGELSMELADGCDEAWVFIGITNQHGVAKN